MDVAEQQPVAHDASSAGGRRVPTTSYGPFRLLEALPWLMLAAALRVVGFGKGFLMLPAMAFAGAALVIAFLLAARRMIEMSDGITKLGELDFAAQRRLMWWILGRISLISAATWIGVALLGAPNFAPSLLLGLDGIAFDQKTWIGMCWSSALAVLVFLIVLQAGAGKKPSLTDALHEFAARWTFLLPAILAIALFQIVVSTVQGGVRHLIWIFWQTSDWPHTVKNLIYFGFIVGFAAIRLWGVLWLLTVALRWSYRRSASNDASQT